MKRLRLVAFSLTAFLCLHTTEAQERYWVFFKDKENVQFDPYDYFDARTIFKRKVNGIPLTEYTDLPVNDTYIKGIQVTAGNIYAVSRWFNAVSIKAGKNKLKEVQSLPYVEKVAPVEMKSHTTKKPFVRDISKSDEFLRKQQIESLGGSYFAEKGIDGRGVRIAIFDSGFPGVDTSPVFEHLRAENRIIATWDFARNKENVYSYGSHGTNVLTCIAGQLEDKKFGLATGAEFLLARTEIRREVFSEEENWLAAMEWADKHGADIINSSLGYTHHRYKPNQMDGKSTLVSRAASMAASKGMLVVNAAGNDGSGSWKVIGAPADSDSVLSVGGVNPFSGYKINFSSFGPTFDRRMKPNVIAFGRVTTSSDKEIKNSSGTSFSAPLVAGFAACVMQMNPDWSAMQTFDEIQKSGHLYPYFDYAHGYGIPQAAYFTGDQNEAPPSFAIVEETDSVKIIFQDHTPSEMPDSLITEIDTSDDIKNDKVREESHSQNNGRYSLDDEILYFHISGRNDNDMLRRYALVRINEKSISFGLPKADLEGSVLRVFYRGYFAEYPHVF